MVKFKPTDSSKAAFPLPTENSEPNDQLPARLSRSDQFFLFVIVLSCFAIIAVRNFHSRGTAQESLDIRRLEQNQFLFQIEINSATWVEWMQLEGIGETTARKIVEDREANGPFLSTANVTRIKGIGPVTLQKIEPHLRCDNCQEAVDLNEKP